MKLARRWVFLLERNEQIVARFAADHARDMAAAGGVFRQHHVAGSEGANRAVAGFDLDLAGEGDYILPSGRGMITAQVVRRRGAKHDAVGGLQRGRLHAADGVELNFDVFEVRFVVRPGVKPDDLHSKFCRGFDGEKQTTGRNCGAALLRCGKWPINVSYAFDDRNRSAAMSEEILHQLAADMNRLLTEPAGSRRVEITDLTPRDGQQCKLATRVTTDDLLPLCAALDTCGFHAVEVWGGATFDVCMRYLKEDPWERLRRIKAVMPKTKLQMLLRGQHILAYRPYTDKIVYKFVERAIANGMNV